jgi:hypothetical protein
MSKELTAAEADRKAEDLARSLFRDPRQVQLKPFRFFGKLVRPDGTPIVGLTFSLGGETTVTDIEGQIYLTTEDE